MFLIFFRLWCSGIVSVWQILRHCIIFDAAQLWSCTSPQHGCEVLSVGKIERIAYQVNNEYLVGLFDQRNMGLQLLLDSKAVSSRSALQLSVVSVCCRG